MPVTADGIAKALVSFSALAFALLASLQVEYSTDWIHDVRFWTPLLSCLAISVAFVIHHYEHDRSRVSSGVLLFFWLDFIILHGVQLRASISLEDHKQRLPRLIVLSTIEGLGIGIFVLEWLVPKKKSYYAALEDDEDAYECPIAYADIFSYLTFSWMTPMMKHGYKKFLMEDDLWDLRKEDTAAVAGDNFASAWNKQLLREKPNLWLAMFQAFGAPYSVATLFKVMQDILAFVQPQLLRLLITFVESYRSGKPQPTLRGFAIALAMFATSVIQTTCLHQYFMHAFETGMRIKSSLTAAIYKKSMVLSNEGRASKSTGDIVNLQAVDTQRLQDITQYGQQVCSLRHYFI